MQPENRQDHPRRVWRSAPPRQGSAATSRRGFRIAGRGASAGGLEALEQFLANAPADGGIAFVVVQHEDPTHQGNMTELLQRSTRMKVDLVKDPTSVQPGCVCVIPPHKDMSLLHDTVHLFEPIAPRGLRRPIGFFFRSLAKDQGERRFGSVLSGLGADGTLGRMAIKEAGGLVRVRTPATARPEGMPRSAIESGVADVVAPAGELGNNHRTSFRHATRVAHAETLQEPTARTALAKIIILPRAHPANDFALYKRSTHSRRDERRTGRLQIGQIVRHVRCLQEHSQDDQQVPARDGCWFGSRIMPYRTPEDRIDDVGITFADITGLTKLEADQRRAHDDVVTREPWRTLELEDVRRFQAGGGQIPARISTSPDAADEADQ